jgi:hypothetical protein
VCQAGAEPAKAQQQAKRIVHTDSVMNRPGGTVSNSRFDGVVATLRTSP